MKKSLLTLCACFFAALSPVHATSNYEYGADEYVTVGAGASPDGKYAITTHGGGEMGYDNFHVYLTDAVAGKKIGPLEEAGGGPLDTGADAFAALWSKDSTQVTVIWRVDRHAPLRACTFKIANRRATALKGGEREATDAEGAYWRKHAGKSDEPPGKIYGTPKPKKDGE